MKKFLFALLLSVPAYVHAQCGTRQVFNPPGPDYGLFIQGHTPAASFYWPVGPGDTLVLGNAFNWTYFSIEGYHGTAECPIVIINPSGGEVWLKYGFQVRNSSHIKVTGTGNSSVYYGFRVDNDASPTGDGPGVAVDIYGKTRNVLVERIDVKGKGYGVYSKTDPQCDSSYNWRNSTMENIVVQQCRFRKIGQDCIYAGNTSPTGMRDLFCDYGAGVQMYRYVPQRGKNVIIRDCIIDSCGRTAIQISGYDQGINLVYNNVITRTGFEWNQQQGYGIAVGGLSTNTYVYNNYIRETFLYGIGNLGSGTNYFHGNNIDSSGFLRPPPGVNADSLAAALGLVNVGGYIKNTYSQPSAIFVDTRQTWNVAGSVNNQGPDLDSSRSIIMRNIVGANATSDDNDIYFYQSFPTYHRGNVVCGNVRQDGTPASFGERHDTDPGLVPPVDLYTTCNVPRAWAGTDYTVAGDTAVLMGHAAPSLTDSIVSYSWQKVSGPGATSMPNPNRQRVIAMGLQNGTYTFRVTATQLNGATATDEVSITVSSLPNIPGTKFAIPGRRIIFKTF